MSHSHKLKRAARKVPVIGRVLEEKERLYNLVISQKQQIGELSDINTQLRRKLGAVAGKSTIWPLLKNEILKAESHKPTERLAPKHRPPYSLNWVVPAVIASSGGQTDIFRTIKYLEQQGHDCRIYIFDPTNRSSTAAQKELIKQSFPGIAAKIQYNPKSIADCDAIFATHWLTAYLVYNYRGLGKKYYFVQGYEPHTQPAGYMSWLAERTYTFGFRGLSLGKWVKEKLTKEYDMRCDYFDFGYDPQDYFLKPNIKRTKDVFFYAQPQKAHRGFELGILALEIFHKKNPNSKIYLFGSDLSDYKIPFPFTDLGVMTIPELNDLYNRCAAGLSLSFTNISLIPLEMIAAGCAPVVNDAYHNRQITYSKQVIYAGQTPQATADALEKAIKTNLKFNSRTLSTDHSWDVSNHQIENYLIKELS